MVWLILSAFSGILIGITVWAVNAGYGIYALGAAGAIACIAMLVRRHGHTKQQKKKLSKAAKRQKAESDREKEIQAAASLTTGQRVRYVIAKIFKTLAYLLHILYAVLLCVDRKLNLMIARGNFFDSKELTLGFEIWGFVSIVTSFIGAIILIVKLYKNERITSPKATKKKFTHWAWEAVFWFLLYMWVWWSIYSRWAGIL